jgi:hypothetical protein
VRESGLVASWVFRLGLDKTVVKRDVSIAWDGKKKYVKTWAKRVQQFTRCTRSKSKAFKASKKAMAFP